MNKQTKMIATGTATVLFMALFFLFLQRPFGIPLAFSTIPALLFTTGTGFSFFFLFSNLKRLLSNLQEKNANLLGEQSKLHIENVQQFTSTTTEFLKQQSEIYTENIKQFRNAMAESISLIQENMADNMRELKEEYLKLSSESFSGIDKCQRDMINRQERIISDALTVITEKITLLAKEYEVFQNAFDQAAQQNKTIFEQMSTSHQEDIKFLFSDLKGLLSNLQEKNANLLGEQSKLHIENVQQFTSTTTEFFKQQSEIYTENIKQFRNAMAESISLIQENMADNMRELQEEYLKLSSESFSDIDKCQRDMLNRQERIISDALIVITEKITLLAKEYEVFQSAFDQAVQQNKTIFEQMSTLHQEDIKYMEKLFNE